MQPAPELVNIVASASFGGPVDLLGLYMSEGRKGGNIMYEPEQFPGVTYRMENPRGYARLRQRRAGLHRSQKREDVHQAISELLRRLEGEKLI